MRSRAPARGALTYDYGTYAGGNAFTSLGPTTGTVVYGTGGTVTMDIPAATGATSGAVLANPFVLTYDGVTGGDPDWVDHAPGGTSPTDSARGADYTVGPCDAGGATAAVQLTAPVRIVGGGKNATITGKALPGRAGVDVALTRTNVTTKVFHATTAADGSFTFIVPVHETTRVRAAAEGISSQTLTITVKSTVRISVRRLAERRGADLWPDQPAAARAGADPEDDRVPPLEDDHTVPSREGSASCCRGRRRAATRPSTSRKATGRSGRPRTRSGSAS